MSLEESMKRQLDQREQSGILRSLRIDECDIDFYSNDYLSLANFPTKSNLSEAPGSSRLIAGNTKEHESLEDQIATFFKQESALLFNSGYTANVGVLSSIPKKDDIILFDELSHASIKDGIRLSLAKGIRFKHNNIDDLKIKLENNKDKTCFVITEGLFSMDGTFGKVKEVEELCSQYKAYLIVDEAHSGGTFGTNGKGICHSLGINPFITMFTLGKAFGSHGAAVTCSQTTKDYLINFARSFIYTTALPQSVIHRSIQLLKDDLIAERTKRLHSVIAMFNSFFDKCDFKSDPSSPIKIFTSRDIDELKYIEQSCLKNGVGVKTIFPPTVPEGSSCIRISLHADQTKEDITKLLEIIT